MKEKVKNRLAEVLSDDFRMKLQLGSIYVVIPIMLVYMAIDRIQTDNSIFLTFRFGIILISIVTFLVSKRVQLGRVDAILMTILSLVNALFIGYFSAEAEGLRTPYAMAGMPAIYLGSGIFMPWPIWWQAPGIILLDFLVFLLCVFGADHMNSVQLVAVHGGSALCFAFMAAFLNERYRKLRELEIISNLSLREEIENRDAIIRNKVAEIREAERLIQERDRELRISKSLSELAAQVAHDIRSPLTGLNVASDGLSGVEEDRRNLIKSSVDRINDIANNLLSYQRDIQTRIHREENTKTLSRPVALGPCLDRLVSEKKWELGGKFDLAFTSDEKRFGLFIETNLLEFSRTVSNILNNACEAVGPGGQVRIRLEHENGIAKINISDNGCGISPSQLEQIGRKGVSFKTQGNGLGIYFAKSFVESIGGRLKINSTVGTGTTVLIEVPLAPTPPWTQGTIDVSNVEKIVVVDDDLPIVNLWKRRLPNAQIVHVRGPAQLDEHLNEFSERSIFLVDYQFRGSSLTGVQLIERANIARQSVLVTSRYEDEDVIQAAQRAIVKILAKNWIPYVSIRSS